MLGGPFLAKDLQEKLLSLGDFQDSPNRAEKNGRESFFIRAKGKMGKKNTLITVILQNWEDRESLAYSVDE